MPLLGAPGTWRLAVGTLVALGAVTLFFALRERKRGFAGFAAASALVSVILMFSARADGGLAALRHRRRPRARCSRRRTRCASG